MGRRRSCLETRLSSSSRAASANSVSENLAKRARSEWRELLARIYRSAAEDDLKVLSWGHTLMPDTCETSRHSSKPVEYLSCFSWHFPGYISFFDLWQNHMGFSPCSWRLRKPSFGLTSLSCITRNIQTGRMEKPAASLALNTDLWCAHSRNRLYGSRDSWHTL